MVRRHHYRIKKMSGFERQPAVSLDRASIKAIAKAVASELRGGGPMSHLTEPGSPNKLCQGKTLEGIAARTVLDWQEQGRPDAWEHRGGVYCTAVGPCSGKTYGIDFMRCLWQYSVHVNGSRTSQLFKTEEEAKGWALVLEKMDVVKRG